MNYQTHTLPNGLRIIHKPDDGPVAYCGLAINAGTRDEETEEQGIAHFIEHMLFKGTNKRKAFHIINRLEDVGGELNAYTTKEETFIYSIVLKEDFERAMELMTDIVFNSTFPKQEMEKEVDVILDEIQSYKDSPSELIYDDFEELIFADSPIGRNILGKEELLKKYTKKDLDSFIKKNYNSSDIVFFSLGNFEFKKLIKYAEKYLGHYPATPRLHVRIEPESYVPKQICTEKETHQTHYMLGARAYGMNHPRRLGLYMLNNILGGPGMNSILNISLRERNGLAYNIDSSYTAYSDTGIFSIYLGCDPKNLKKSKSLIMKELANLRNTPIPEAKLNRYKKQLMGQLAIASQNKESLILSIAKSYLHLDKIDTSEDIRKRLADIDSKMLHEIAQEIFAEENLTSLEYK